MGLIKTDVVYEWTHIQHLNLDEIQYLYWSTGHF